MISDIICYSSLRSVKSTRKHLAEQCTGFIRKLFAARIIRLELRSSLKMPFYRFVLLAEIAACGTPPCR